MGAPGLVRSRAATMFGNALCTYITLLMTSGFPSWPFNTPVENVQAALRFFTFDRLICVSGLKRCRSYVRPVDHHCPFGGFSSDWAATDVATSTIRLAASPPDHRLKQFIADPTLRMVKNGPHTFAPSEPGAPPHHGGPRSQQATAILRLPP